MKAVGGRGVKAGAGGRGWGALSTNMRQPIRALAPALSGSFFLDNSEVSSYTTINP